MLLIKSFLFCGFICLVGQIILDNTKLSPGHITSIFVVVGGLLDTFNIYDYFIKNVGGGSILPITSFGHSLVHGSMIGVSKYGILGIINSTFLLVTPGIVLTIFLSVLFTLIFKAKD